MIATEWYVRNWRARAAISLSMAAHYRRNCHSALAREWLHNAAMWRRRPLRPPQCQSEGK